MKTEKEVRAKRDEAYKRFDNYDGPVAAQKEFYEQVALLLGWVLGEDDDPFMDEEVI